MTEKLIINMNNNVFYKVLNLKDHINFDLNMYGLLTVTDQKNKLKDKTYHFFV